MAPALEGEQPYSRAQHSQDSTECTIFVRTGEKRNREHREDEEFEYLHSSHHQWKS